MKSNQLPYVGTHFKGGGYYLLSSTPRRDEVPTAGRRLLAGGGGVPYRFLLSTSSITWNLYLNRILGTKKSSHNFGTVLFKLFSFFVVFKRLILQDLNLDVVQFSFLSRETILKHRGKIHQIHFLHVKIFLVYHLTYKTFSTFTAKLLNADWFRQRAFFFFNFPSMEDKIAG